MNLDFARAQTSGAEPNLRVISNLGLSRFTVPVGTATITDLKFGDGDLDTGNEWAGSISGRNVVWAAPIGHSLDWGTMFRFSFVANQPPVKNTFALGIASPGSPTTLKGTGSLAPRQPNTLGPGGLGPQ